MAFAIQMRPDVTLETAREDSRDCWTKRARIAVANEMCGSIPVGGQDRTLRGMGSVECAIDGWS